MDKVKINGDLTDREMLVARRAAEGVLMRLKPELHALLVAVAIALALSIGGSLTGWLITRDESRTRVAAIQDSRYKTVRDNCIDTNARNRSALSRLQDLSFATPGDSSREQSQTDAIRALIDALVPYRLDCAVYARQRVYGPAGP